MTLLSSTPHPHRARTSVDDAGFDPATDPQVVGPAAATSELYRRHARDVHRYVASKVPAAMVDDVVSETFARTLRAMQNGSGPRDHPVRYLIVTSRSVLISMGTSDVRIREASTTWARLSLPLDRPEEHGDDDAEEVRRALSHLRPRHRAVLWMTEVEGRPAAQIGEVLGIGPEAVYALAFRARRALRAAYLAGQDGLAATS